MSRQDPYAEFNDGHDPYSEFNGAGTGPTIQEQKHYSDNRSAGQVAMDQIGNVASGMASTITGLPGMISDLASGTYQAVTGGGTSKLQSTVGGAISGMAAPFKPVLETMAGSPPSPDSQEWVEGAQGAGAMLGGLLLPELTGKLSKVKALRNLPDNLMLRAAENRQPSGPTLAETMTSIASPRVGGVVKKAGQPYRNMKAGMQERLAKAMTFRDRAPAVPDMEPLEGPPLGVPSSPVNPNPAVGMAGTAKNPGYGGGRANPLIQESRPPIPEYIDRTPLTTPERMNIPRPGAGEMPPNEGLPSEAMMTKPNAVPGEEIPFNGEGMGVSQPPSSAFDTLGRNIHDAISPKGSADQKAILQMTTPIGGKTPELLRAAPELMGLSKPHLLPEQFDRALISAFDRVEHNVDLASKAVPDNVMVPKQHIMDGLQSIADTYEEAGNLRAQAEVLREQQRWADLDENIPWRTFEKMKRSFYFTHKSISSGLRRAYGVLAEASNEFSGSAELQQANKDYSTVRRAIDASHIDMVTRRRFGPRQSPTMQKVEKVKSLRGMP